MDYQSHVVGNIKVEILHTMLNYYFWLFQKCFYNQLLRSWKNEKQCTIENLFITFNHSEGTQRAYVYALEKYTTYFEMELNELLKEAEIKEFEGIKWKHRKIKFRLLEFRQYLLENYTLNTVKSVMINDIKFYKF